jgi:MoxR-like ATPase
MPLTTTDDWSGERLVEHLPPPPGEPDQPTWDEVPEDDVLVDEIQLRLGRYHFDVEPWVIRSFIYALRTDRFAVLAGKSGTGKTSFVRYFCRALQDILTKMEVRQIIVPVRPDMAEWELLGHQSLAGDYVPSPAMRELNRAHGAGGAIRLILLDEMNLAVPDLYATALLSAVTNRIPIDLPGETQKWVGWLRDDGKWLPPPGTVAVGTVNSYLEEPGRQPLSGPVKRRSSQIDFPDRVHEYVEANDEPGFRSFCETLRQQLRATADDTETFLMADPTAAFEEPIEDEVLEVLWSLATLLAPRPEVAMTAGVIQSMVGLVAVGPGWEIEALMDAAVAQKVLPIVRGDEDLLDEIAGALAKHGGFGRSNAAITALRVASRRTGVVRPIY